MKTAGKVAFWILIAVAIAGCSAKVSGEMSLLKRLDRHPETITSSQTDVPATTTSQQGSAGTVK